MFFQSQLEDLPKPLLRGFEHLSNPIGWRVMELQQVAKSDQKSSPNGT